MWIEAHHEMIGPDNRNRDTTRAANMKQVILIIATTGHARDGLRALLTTMRQVTILACADEQSAAAVAENHPPSLVILDIDPFGDSALGTVKRIKHRWPDTPCLVLVDLAAQRKQAHEAGANATWLKGLPADSLVAIIEGLLSRQDDHQNQIDT